MDDMICKQGGAHLRVYGEAIWLRGGVNCGAGNNLGLRCVLAVEATFHNAQLFRGFLRIMSVLSYEVDVGAAYVRHGTANPAQHGAT